MRNIDPEDQDPEQDRDCSGQDRELKCGDVLVEEEIAGMEQPEDPCGDEEYPEDGGKRIGDCACDSAMDRLELQPAGCDIVLFGEFGGELHSHSLRWERVC